MKRPRNAHEGDQRGDERVGELFRGERQEVRRQPQEQRVPLEGPDNRGIQAQLEVQRLEKPPQKPRRATGVFPAGGQPGQIVQKPPLRALRQTTRQSEDSRGYITATWEGKQNRGTGPTARNRDSIASHDETPVRLFIKRNAR